MHDVIDIRCVPCGEDAGFSRLHFSVTYSRDSEKWDAKKLQMLIQARTLLAELSGLRHEAAEIIGLDECHVSQLSFFRKHEGHELAVFFVEMGRRIDGCELDPPCPTCGYAYNLVCTLPAGHEPPCKPERRG